MRVGLDLLYLIPGETGGREAYARELVPAMLDQMPALELIAFHSRDLDARLVEELGEGIRAVRVPVSTRSRAQWACGELALVSLAARKERVELLHSPANFAPPWGPFRRIVTIHDLQYRAVPELLSTPARAATHALVSLAARGADRIIAVSAAGGEEIAAGLGVERAKIDVIPNGVRPPATGADGGDARERYRLGERPVVLTVATNLPHKNLPVLFEALALIPPEGRPVLAIAGHGTGDPELHAAASASGVGPDVRLLGGRSTIELDSLYAVAACLVLPTLHEGFGLPVLEAMARSVPVACSDIAALREIGGAAALYFDPHDPSEIAAKIDVLLANPGVAHRICELGRARAKQFSWSSAAALTLDSYRRALNAHLGQA